MLVVIHVRLLSQRFGSQIAAGEYEIIIQAIIKQAITGVLDPPATGGGVGEI